MRHSSERVPGKNYRKLAGRPLFAHVVETLLDVPEIGDVVIDTDSPTIRSYCEAHYPSVVLIDRPEHLRDGHTAMTDVIRHDVAETANTWYLQTHSTNPFLRQETISRGLNALRESNDHDSLFSVTRVLARFYGPDGKALNHDPENLLRTQDLSPLFLENSCMYVFSRSCALEGRRIGASPLMFEIEGLEAHDIDTEADWAIAEAIAGADGGVR